MITTMSLKELRPELPKVIARIDGKLDRYIVTKRGKPVIVMEKTKDIGILRALGATRASVAGLFLWQGCLIGFLGIGLGLAGGLALARNLNPIADWLERTFGWSLFPRTIYYLDRIPALINASDVIAVAGAAFGLAVLAGTYAAIRAAALAPVDALRYE